MNILDLEPDAFMSALDELQLPADQRDMLLRQYRKGNSPLARLYEGIQSVREGDEGRTRASILPMTRPEGMSGYEAIKEGEAEFAVPEFLLGSAESLLNVLDMPGATVRGPVSTDEVAEVALETAGTLALPSVGARLDPNVARMFGGRGTRNEGANRAMDRAEELWQQGESPEDIWAVTAEEFPQSPASVLPDGRPFYEMSDAEAVTRDLAVERAQTMASEARSATDPEEMALLRQESRRLLDEQPVAGILPTPLSDVMSHPQLYQDFPVTEDITTQLRAPLERGIGGMYYPPSSSSPRGAIQLSSVYSGLPGKEAGVLLHETQHGIANLTGGIPKGQHWNTIRSRVRDLELDVQKRAARGGDAADDIENRLAQLEESSSDTSVFQAITDPLYGEISVMRETTNAPLRELTKVLYGPEGLTRGFETQEPAYALYHLDPGEAIARAADKRRELSMDERRALSPMETLRQERRPIDWEELVKLESAQDLQDYLLDRYDVDLSTQMVERGGLQRYTPGDYAKALDLTIDDLPSLLSEVTEKADRSATAEARQKAITEGRDRVRRLFETKLKGFR